MLFIPTFTICYNVPRIFIYYNTESEGLDAGEKSRFITQLEVEKQRNHNLTHEIYNAVLPETAYTPMVIENLKLL
jgi:hypothetical protein